jgi:hypothetical protein
MVLMPQGPPPVQRWRYWLAWLQPYCPAAPAAVAASAAEVGRVDHQCVSGKGSLRRRSWQEATSPQLASEFEVEL